MPSYSPVFSQGFVYYGPSDEVLEATVDEGFTAVVREILVTQYDSPYSVGLYIREQAAFEELQVIADESSGTYNTYEWQGRIVVPGGGTIRLFVNDITAHLSAYVGGYLLRNTLT